MENIIFVDKEKRREMKQYAENLDKWLQAFINLFAALSSKLALIVTHPKSLKIFSMDEIREINLAERRIPQAIEKLQEMHEQVRLENYPFILGNDFKERCKASSLLYEELNALAEQKEKMIPKFRPDLLFWLMSPHKAISFYAYELMHKIRMRKLDREKEVLLKKQKK